MIPAEWASGRSCLAPTNVYCALTRLDRRGIFFVYWRTCDIFKDVSTKGRICTCPGLSHDWGVDPIYNTCHVLSHASQVAVFFFYVGGYFILMLKTILIIISSINLSKDRGNSHRILLSHTPRMWRYFISIIEVILNCKRRFDVHS